MWPAAGLERPVVAEEVAVVAAVAAAEVEVEVAEVALHQT